MNREHLIRCWNEVANTDSLLTPKHDPNNLLSVDSKYRSVVTFKVSSSLKSFIKSEDYTINHYSCSRYPSTPDYYELIPKSSDFSFTGMGVPSGSIIPSGSHDRLVIISGSSQGWHIIAENSARISVSVVDGSLQKLETLW